MSGRRVRLICFWVPVLGPPYGSRRSVRAASCRVTKRRPVLKYYCMTETSTLSALAHHASPLRRIRPTRATAPLVSRCVRAGYAASTAFRASTLSKTSARPPLDRACRPHARIFRGELSLDAQRSHRTRRPPHPRINRKAISGAPVEGALSEGGVVMDAVLVRDEIGSASDDA